MFDKLLGKKEKGIKIFSIPEKKYCTDGKKIGKMDKKDLVDLVEDIEKYVKNLTEKLELGKKEYETAIEKVDEVSQKHKILNDEMCRINNEHEELSVKFTNLQTSLECLTMQKHDTLQSEIDYLHSKNLLPREKVKDIAKIFTIFHDQISLSEKISSQNKQLKQKYSNLQMEYFQLSDKFNEQKNVVTTNDVEMSPKETHKNMEQHQQKSQQSDPEDAEDAEGEKLAHYKSILEGKQQIIVSLNKQISAQKAHSEQIDEEKKQIQLELNKIVNALNQKEADFECLQNNNKQLGEKLEQSRKKIVQLEKKALENLDTLAKMENEVKQKSEDNEKMKKFVEESKKIQQRIEQQKNVLLETNRTQLSDANASYSNSLQQCEKLSQKLEGKQIEIENINQKLKTYENQISRLMIQNKQYSESSKIIEQLKQKIASQEKRFNQATENYSKNEENYQIKIKKLQFQMNHEKIKFESMKRTLNLLETKDTENQTKLDEMYETKMRQEGKLVHLEKKLKEYKHLIQYLKKEKVEMEKTFENKLKNFEEMVVYEPDEEDEGTPSIIKDHRENYQEADRNQNDNEAEMTIINNKMVDLEETLEIVKVEGKELRSRNNDLELQNTNLKNTIKTLNEKREQAMKQIRKLATSKAPFMKNPSINDNSEETKARVKKIAEKAFRGFDILSKQLHPLYKQFINIHIKDIQKPEVKEVETGINMLVKKTMDMKDIFQDYI